MKKMKVKDIEESIKLMSIENALEYLNEIKMTQQANVNKLIEKYEKKLEKKRKEFLRLDEMMVYEKKAAEYGFNLVCGIDEAGRGPLAGPVVAGAVILPQNIYIEGLNDSKKVSPEKREVLFDIIGKSAIAYGVGIIDEKQIDKINILNATKEAMREAVRKLIVKPDCLLVDAERIENINIKQKAIIKGDTLSISIAAASIMAKVTRDRIMEQYDEIYPDYGFKKHKGYGTQEHIHAIKKFGICPIHRIGFTKKFI